MNTVMLRDGDLRAQVLAPENSRYKRTRFNHSGFIADVWYAGTRFTQYERNQNDGFISTDGCGLCSSYDGDQTMRDARVGEWYLKPGVGLIRREEKDWGICDWPAYQPLDTRMEAEERAAYFETDTPNVNGYAYHEERRVRLEGDQIRLEVLLRNTGEKPLIMEDYCHNFISLGDAEIGPAYRLDVPAMRRPQELNDSPLANALTGDEKGFTFSGEILKAFYGKTFDVTSAPVTWKMTHRDMTAFVQEADSFTPGRIAVWGDYYVLSCEVFMPIDLAPGGEVRFTRTWTFGA